MKCLLGAVAIAALALPLGAGAVTLNYSGVTQAGGPHDSFSGELDVTDTPILDGRLGSGGSSVRTGYAGEANVSEASDAEYQSLVASDDDWYVTIDPGLGDNAWIRFEFDTGLTASEISSISEVSVEIEALQGATTDDWYVFAWDYGQSRYLRFGGAATPNGADELRSGTLIAGYISDNGVTLGSAADLVDSSGQLTILAVNLDTSDTLRVDTISVEIISLPEPAIPALLVLGLLGLGTRLRRSA